MSDLLEVALARPRTDAEGARDAMHLHAPAQMFQNFTFAGCECLSCRTGLHPRCPDRTESRHGRAEPAPDRPQRVDHIAQRAVSRDEAHGTRTTGLRDPPRSTVQADRDE